MDWNANMKTFKQRLMEAQREFHYRLKTVVDLTDDRMENLERLLDRYKLIRIGAIQKVDGDLDTLEFTDVENSNIIYVDFAIGVPVSAYILQQEIRSILSVPEKFVVVRSDNEAIEVDSARIQLLQTLDKLAADAGHALDASLLSTNPRYLDAEQPLPKDIFGDTYNKKFLNYLSKVASTRTTSDYFTQDDFLTTAQREAHAKQMHPEMDDFNKAYDTPKPVYKNKYEDLPEPVESTLVNMTGGLDDDRKRYFKVKKNIKGETVVYDMFTAPVRGDKS
jgi:hypothetical protein